MAKKTSKIKFAQQNTEIAIIQTNKKIKELGLHACALFMSLNDLQLHLDAVQDTPDAEKSKYEELKKIRLRWRDVALSISEEYRMVEVDAIKQGFFGKNSAHSSFSMSPTFAMGCVTAFGLASSSKHYDYAPLALKAWIGGSALALDGSDIVAKNELLKYAGPVGLAMAALSIIPFRYELFMDKNKKDRLDDIVTRISNRDIQTYEYAIMELDGRIERIKQEVEKLKNAIIKLQSAANDFQQMTELQKQELFEYSSLMEASIKQLVNPILGLKPKYITTDTYFNIPSVTICWIDSECESDFYDRRRKMFLTLHNLLYGLELENEDRELLVRYFKKNKELMSYFGVYKEEFKVSKLLDAERFPDILNELDLRK